MFPITGKNAYKVLEFSYQSVGFQEETIVVYQVLYSSSLFKCQVNSFCNKIKTSMTKEILETGHGLQVLKRLAFVIQAKNKLYMQLMLDFIIVVPSNHIRDICHP